MGADRKFSAQQRNAGLAILVSVAVGAVMAWAGGRGGLVWSERLSVFALGGVVCFAVNWVAFVPAYLWQTERYYDLIGSVTYLSVAGLALAFGNRDPRALLLGALVAVWASRLGSFLFLRIRSAGSDGRFDKIKPSFLRFLMAWTLQGLWVYLTLSCALAAMTSASPAPLGFYALAGLAVWLFGFSLEVLADRQKSAFRADDRNRGRFIDVGLWAWSRHPNYFGEILLWCGVAILAAPVLRGWQYLTLISPVFVAFLLLRISGIPLLEARSDERWGGQSDYEAYKARTPVLIPRPPALGRAQ